MLVRLYDLPDAAGLRGRLWAEGVEIRRALAPEKQIVASWSRRTFTFDKQEQLWSSNGRLRQGTAEREETIRSELLKRWAEHPSQIKRTYGTYAVPAGHYW
jgi:hypothetical protein